MLRPNAEFVAAAADFICVRITDIQDLDLNRYPFDYDLTMAILLANADGTIYHRYGGRPRRNPLAWTTRAGLIALMRATLVEHRLYETSPASAKARGKGKGKGKGKGNAKDRHTVYDIESFARRMGRKKEKPACIHCHQIHEAQVRDQQERKVFDLDSIWVWPQPDRIGLQMDPESQTRIAAVAKDSAAAKAGLRPNDHLTRAGDQSILTINDLPWVLHRMPMAGGDLALSFRRGEKTGTTTLRAAKNFKRTDPLTYSWRSLKWSLRPAPGMGGTALSEAEKTRHGIAKKAWAFRVTYIVDWGDRPEQGRENRRRGIRSGDIVTSWGGRNDFVDLPHFHAWVRLTRKRGEKITIELLRRGEPKTVVVTLL